MDFSKVSFYKVFVLLMLSRNVMSRYFSSIPVEANQVNMRKLANANNYFALNLHQRLTANGMEENVFFSPLSLTLAFGMLLYGARGGTATELRSALGFQKADLPSEFVHLTFRRYLSEMALAGASKGYAMNIANGILIDKRLGLSTEYKDAVETLYHAPVQKVNFLLQAPKVKNSINNWVNSKTNGKINRLLEDLSSETIMIILNAVYFKGLWKIPFDEAQTSNQVFYNNGQESLAKRVPTMNMAEVRFPYISTENYQVLELPYEGNISMVIFLPNQRDGLPALESSLTLQQFNSIRRRLKPTEITISLPKFRIEYGKSLNKELQELGLRQMFLSGVSDLSGISRGTDLKVSDVVHKAFVNVDEVGTEAAAATGLKITPYSDTMVEDWFIADHPFLFTIVDKTRDIIMFMGRVNSL